MNRVLRDQIWAMARQAGAEFYEGFLGSPNSIDFKEDQFERFAHAIEQMIEAQAEAAYDKGRDEGYDAGQTAAESQSAFEARNQE